MGEREGVRTSTKPTETRVPMEMTTEVPGRSTMPFNTTQCGSVSMSDYASPRFSMVHSPVNYYSPYSQYMCPLFQPPESSNMFASYRQYYQPPIPLTVCFITGNISVCIGCKNKYPKSPKPPQDICIKHEEWREFTTGMKQQSKFGNVYYHCRKECIWMRCPAFTSAELYIPPEINLLSVHKELLFSVFGI